MERLNICLGKARRGNKLLAVLYLDLDLFKSVNDGIGYISSDAVLQELAKRLTACVRDADTVARVGGDEFVVLLPEIVRADDAATVAHKLLESIAEPFSAGSRGISSDDFNRREHLPRRRRRRGNPAAQRGQRHVPGEAEGP